MKLKTPTAFVRLSQDINTCVGDNKTSEKNEDFFKSSSFILQAVCYKQMQLFHNSVLPAGDAPGATCSACVDCWRGQTSWSGKVENTRSRSFTTWCETACPGSTKWKIYATRGRGLHQACQWRQTIQVGLATALLRDTSLSWLTTAGGDWSFRQNLPPIFGDPPHRTGTEMRDPPYLKGSGFHDPPHFAGRTLNKYTVWIKVSGRSRKNF